MPRFLTRNGPTPRLGLLVLAALCAAGSVRPALAADRWDVSAAAAKIADARDAERQRIIAEIAGEPWEPWLLAEHLRARGKPKLAERYAEAVGRRAAGLQAHLRDQSHAHGSGAALAALEKARLLLAGGDPAACLTLLGASVPRGLKPSVTAAAAAMLEADAYKAQSKLADCAAASLKAGDAAAGVGWTRLASEAYKVGLNMAYASNLLDRARECALGLRAIQERLGDAQGVAASCHNLGGIASQRGDLSGALRHVDEALARFEALNQPGDAADARSLRSVTYAQMGKLREALEDQRLLRADESVFKTPSALAGHLSNAGIVYTHLGDVDGATVFLERAVAVAKAAGDRMAEAAAHGNRGLARQLEADWDASIEAYRKALALYEAGGWGLNVAISKLAIADALQDQAVAELAGETEAAPKDLAARRSRVRDLCEEARQLLREALTVFESAGAAGGAAVARGSLCRVSLLLGETEGLAARFQAACNEHQRLYLWGPLVHVSADLVRHHVQAAEWKSALREGKIAVARLARGYGGLTDGDIARARAYEADVYDLGIHAAAAAGDVDALHFFLESGRASALLRGMGGRAAALRATVPSELQRKLAAQTAIKARAAAALSKVLRDGQGKRSARAAYHKATKAYETARAAEFEILREIGSLEQAAAAHLVPPRVEVLDDLQRHLPLRPGDGAPTIYLAFNLQAENGWCLRVTAREKRLVHYDAKAMAAIRKALAEIVSDRHGEYDAGALDALRKHLVTPLDLPVGGARYLVSPDRELAYTPLAGLLPGKASVALVPSATTYLLLREQRSKRGEHVLALGDPDYAGVPNPDVHTSRGGPRLEPLPETRLEVQAIAAGKQDVRLFDKQATETGLVRALRSRGPEARWRSVHLACHGYVDVEWPALCALELTPGEGEDGHLTAAEVLRLPLNTDLAVLSACETGRGRYVRGEGMMGLARSFMFAGAPRVLVSLWRVADEPARIFMQAFYRAWSKGLAPAEAVAAAQRHVRDYEEEEPARKSKDGKPTTRVRPFSAPADWAAWVLWGLPD